MKITGLQIFYKHQKQWRREENMKKIRRTYVTFCFNVFEEKTLTLFIFKPHIYLIFCPFYVI
jgi:hypothetical protein